MRILAVLAAVCLIACALLGCGSPADPPVVRAPPTPVADPPAATENATPEPEPEKPAEPATPEAPSPPPMPLVVPPLPATVPGTAAASPIPVDQLDPKGLDMAYLQGEWAVNEIGEPGAIPAGLRMVIAENRMELRFQGKSIPFGSFTIDPLQSPKQIDLELNSPGGRGVRKRIGIYELDGDELRICQEGDTRETKRGEWVTVPAVRPITFDGRGAKMVFTAVESRAGRVSYVAPLTELDVVCRPKLRGSLGEASDEITYGAIAFHPTKPILATAMDNDLFGWDFETREIVFQLKDASEHGFENLLFSPDGELLLSSGRGRDLRIWDWKAGSVVKRLETPGTLVQFLPDGALAIGAFDALVRLWKPKTWEPAGEFQGHHGSIQAFAFAGGQLFSIGLNDEALRIWDQGTQRLQHTIVGQGHILSMAAARDGKTLVTNGRKGVFQLWDTKPPDGKPVVRTSYPTGLWDVQRIALSPDDSLAAILSSGGVTLWNLRNGKHVARIRTKAHCHDLAFSPDGKLLAFGSLNGLTELWDLGRTK